MNALRRTKYWQQYIAVDVQFMSKDFISVKKQNKTTHEIPVSANSVTNMPPPAAAKAAP